MNRIPKNTITTIKSVADAVSNMLPNKYDPSTKSHRKKICNIITSNSKLNSINSMNKVQSVRREAEAFQYIRMTPPGPKQHKRNYSTNSIEQVRNGSIDTNTHNSIKCTDCYIGSYILCTVLALNFIFVASKNNENTEACTKRIMLEKETDTLKVICNNVPN